MTWLQLADKIRTMSSEQQETDVTIALLNSSEAVQVLDFVSDWNESKSEREEVGLDFVEGVLDDNHPYLTIAN